MRLRPEQLQTHLERELRPVYLVTGDETLLVQESCDAIRRAARAAGCTEREVFQVDNRFNWDNLVASASEMSLFADRKIIEVHIPSGKPGTDGSKGLLAYLDRAGDDNLLLIVAGKIDKQSTNSKWFKALDAAGAVVQIWPVDASQLPRWVTQRVENMGMSIEQDALLMLCDRVEGNLLAAVQEIEKLRLLCPDNRISVAAVAESVADNARYNLFGLIDQALLGDAAGALKMLNGLRGEGTEAAVVLWGLAREIRLLLQCKTELERGQRQQQVMKANRVWDKRVPIVTEALQRHHSHALAELLQAASNADQSIKGMADGNPWDHLSRLILELSLEKPQAA
ncbi:MAG: DNA polymerase III subunit delta [Halieaceae bacterium]|jgi:DNA polymerase-3 subunit delta|nr:DNA polymerase III subunit delta [Halieaceae bacterium]